MRDLTSYISCRNLNGICIPLPIQTNFLRSYSETKNMILSMPNVEWTNSLDYPKLLTLINDNQIKEIAICSIFMIDFLKLEKEFKEFKNTIIFHFPLENKILNFEESVHYYKIYQNLRLLSKDICDFI